MGALFRIIPLHATDKVLEVKDGSLAVGAEVVIYKKRTTDFDGQLWTLDYKGRIKNKKSGLFISVKNKGGDYGVVLTQVTQSQALNWSYNSNNSISLINSSLFADVKLRATNDNNDVILFKWDSAENKHQRFTLEFYGVE